MNKPLVVYHTKSPSTSCLDGFCAAAILWRKLGDDAEYVPVMYHQDIPLERFLGREVYMVDFSYELDRMDQIASAAKSLKMFDHHAARGELFKSREYAVHSNTACGAVLVWQYLYGDAPIPYMLELIDDADRFLNTHMELEAFLAALTLEEPSFRRWSDLLDLLTRGSDFTYKFLERGQGLALYDATRVAGLVKEAFPIALCGVQGLIVNTNKFHAHDVAIALAGYSKTFGAAFYVRSDGNVEVSLRRLDPNINVERIAKTFGGGGHDGAAAFAVSLRKFKELAHPESKSELYTRIERSMKLFQQTLDKTKYSGLPQAHEDFLNHMQAELGSFVADDLEFCITESAGHPGPFTRFMSGLAQLLGFPKVVSQLRWYHKPFPYVLKREVAVDDDAIRDVLLESKGGSKNLNKFLVDRLMETVNVSNKAELVTSIYYIHVSVKLPGSKLTVRHTFEVFK